MKKTALLSLVLTSGALAAPSDNSTTKPASPPAPVAAAAKAGKTQVTWFGHAAFRIDTPSGKTILIDPWIDNPSNKAAKDNLAKLTSVQLILVSHGHSDHVGNAVEIAKKTRAKLVTTFDLGHAIANGLGYPADLAGMDTQGNFGGRLSLLDGEVTVTFVPAVHSSQVSKDEKSPGIDGGAPGGFLVQIKNGPTIYHTGDTDVFSDMSLIAKFAKVDVMLACIGGHFTMDPARAAHAATLVRPKWIVPMHFGTFPLLAGTPDELAKELRKSKSAAKIKVLAVGETLEL